MPFRFRQSIRLARGLRVNLSKSGATVSMGGRGATVNLSDRGVRGTAGLPGSGVSYSTERAPWRSAWRWIAAIALVVLLAAVLLLSR